MTINYIIVEIDEAYKNEIDGIIVNSTIESVAHINRIAKVVEAPSFTILRKGDDVVVHHNMFRLRNGMRGQRVQSDYHIEDNKYFIPFTEVYMYRRGGEWNAIRPFVFLKPVDFEEEVSNGFTITKTDSNSHKGKKKLRGIVKYLNDELEAQGVKVGDEVLFSYFSEYEFNIDGETLYKMSTKDILAIL
jgi:co-chaperonin GroES (HSP10)